MKEGWRRNGGRNHRLQCRSKGSSRADMTRPVLRSLVYLWLGTSLKDWGLPKPGSRPRGCCWRPVAQCTPHCPGQDTGSSSKADVRPLRPLSPGFCIQLNICVESDCLLFVPDTSRVQHGHVPGVSAFTERLL